MRSFFDTYYYDLCDIGDKKPTNQDRVFSDCANINGINSGLFVVADGVGGLSNGDYISNMIIMYMKEWFENFKINPTDFGIASSSLENAVQHINKIAFDYSVKAGEKMGSTIALLFFIGNQYVIKNIGDSRIYQNTKKNYLIHISQDHSLVAQLVRNGEITPEEAKVHPKRNVLLSCIGVASNVKSYTFGGLLSNKDSFILCSDGFYNYANPQEVLSVLKKKRISPSKRVNLLRDCIPNGNAKDNVSIIYVSFKKRVKLF